MDLLVTYDISTTDRDGQRRLSKVAAICERYGERVQYSVFECRLDTTRRQRLIGELSDAIDPRADSVRLYRLSCPLPESLVNLGVQQHDWTSPYVI